MYIVEIDPLYFYYHYFAYYHRHSRKCIYGFLTVGSSSLSSKIPPMCFLVTSIFLCACELYTLTAELQKRIQAMEIRCYRKILCISYKDRVTNKEVSPKIQQAIGPHEDHLTIVKRRKLKWYRHVFHSSSLAKIILQGTVKGGRRQGGQKKSGKTTSGNGEAWSSLSPEGSGERR